MKTRPTLSIIGLGKVGATLANCAYASQQYNVVVGARDERKARATLKLISTDIPIHTISTAVQMGDIVLLTVSDDAINSVCQTLSQAKTFKENSIVVHCSGALNSDELLSAKEKCRAAIASMHPLQTFPSDAPKDNKLEGSYCYYEGDIETHQTIYQFISHLGMKPVKIQKEDKTLYHAAAVVACNYLSALMDAALEIGETAGIERTTLWQSLEPLITRTLKNISQLGPAKALTGPIARGDIETVNKHIHSLDSLASAEQAARLKKLYSAMGNQCIQLANQKDELPEKAKVKLEEILKL